MFKSKTVFVVGAGAGEEVGLPTGAELSDALVSKLAYYRKGSGFDEEILIFLKNYAAKGTTHLHAYISACTQICLGLPYSRSIDEFINKHRESKLLQFCAKIAIAKTIVEKECSSDIFTHEIPPYISLNNSLTEEFERPEKVLNTWYFEFARILYEGLDKNDIDDVGNDICIINFNYDRSIEHFLFHTLRRSYGVSPARAADSLKSVRILRPYGTVGELPWQLDQGDEGNLGFGDVTTMCKDLTAVSARIRTFYEQRRDFRIARDVTDALAKAERVVFLGFGYHPQNLRLLKPAKTTRAKAIFATAYGESESGARVVRGQLMELLGNDVIKGTGNVYVQRQMKCVDLLKEYSRHLSI